MEPTCRKFVHVVQGFALRSALLALVSRIPRWDGVTPACSVCHTLNSSISFLTNLEIVFRRAWGGFPGKPPPILILALESGDDKIAQRDTVELLNELSAQIATEFQHPQFDYGQVLVELVHHVQDQRQLAMG